MNGLSSAPSVWSKVTMRRDSEELCVLIDDITAASVADGVTVLPLLPSTYSVEYDDSVRASPRISA